MSEEKNTQEEGQEQDKPQNDGQENQDSPEIENTTSQIEETEPENTPEVEETKPLVEEAQAQPEEEPVAAGTAQNENPAPKDNTDSEEPTLPEEQPVEVSPESADKENSSVETPLEETKSEEPSDLTPESEDSSDENVEEEEDEELPDFSIYTREQLVEAIEELVKADSFKRSERILSEIEPKFNEFEANLKKEAQEKYITDGGEEDDFEFRHDELFNRFDASLRLIRDRKTAFYKEREANKTRNLEKKQELLETLRSLVDGEEATTSIKPIKEIQEVWKAIGPVPNQYNKTLWANYNALLDRFYHNRHILFELKDLDRKKNKVLKEELCEKAEALDKLDNVKDAVIQLNELHEEYKKVGAVPREVQEQLWQRFKAASDVVYRKRKDFLEHLKGDLKENLIKKQELIKELGTFSSFDSDRINDWNAKTKEILDLQKKWEALGGVPREKAKEINRAFWSTFKGFFAHKNEFFKKLEALRKENLSKKEELIQEAISLSESQDWDKTAEQLKQLQQKWKEVGPVPEKQRNAIYARFKEACDTFFNNKRQHLNQAESAYVENQQKKEAILDEIAEKSKGKEGSQDELMTLIGQYNEIGFVPRNAIKSVEKKMQQSVKAYIESLSLEESEAESLALRAELAGGNKGGGADRKLQKKESSLRRRINELEDNISLWNNNLAFFANSKTADKLKEEFDGKIAEAEKEIQGLKKQLKVLRSI